MKHYLTLVRDFLTKNTSSKQTVIKNTFWLLLAEGVSKGSNIILLFWMANLVSVEVFGTWNFINALTGFLVVLVDFGLQQLTLREVIKDGVHITKNLFHSAILKVFIGSIIWILLFVATFVLQDLADIRWPLLLVMAYNILYNINELLRLSFRVYEQMEYETYIKIFSGVLLCVVMSLVYIFVKPLTLQAISLGYILSILGQLLITFIFLKRKNILDLAFLVHIQFDFFYLKKILISGIYLALGLLFTTFYQQIDQVMMYFYGMDYELGIYSAMYRLVQLFYFGSSIIVGAYLPTMLIRSHTKLPRKMFFALGIYGLMVLGSFLVGGKSLVTLIFGLKYMDGYNILIIQLFILLIMIFNSLLYQVLIYGKGEKKIIKILFVGVLVYFIGNLIMIPLWGVYGALIMSFVTQTLIFILLYNTYKRFIYSSSENSLV